MARLLSLHLYPIKSCRGITVDSAQLMPYGLAHDREWMVIHADGPQVGTFISQRTHPRLAWVIPRLNADGVEVHLDTAPLLQDAEGNAARSIRTASPDEGAGAGADILRVCSTPLLLPFTSDTSITHGMAAKRAAIDPKDASSPLPVTAPDVRRTVAVWRDTFPALDVGDHAAHWFSTLLGCAVRVVRFDPQETRLASAAWTKDVAAPTTFADGFPLLVTNQSSLDDLNERLAKKGAPPIPMERFRPNVVVSDIAAFEEDFVSDLTFYVDSDIASDRTDGPDTTRTATAITPNDRSVASTVGDGPIVLRFVKPCARCPIPTFDQRTGQADPDWPHEPLDTLMTYRVDARVDGVTFGVNAVIIDGVGRSLRRGMRADAEIGFDD